MGKYKTRKQETFFFLLFFFFGGGGGGGGGGRTGDKIISGNRYPPGRASSIDLDKKGAYYISRKLIGD